MLLRYSLIALGIFQSTEYHFGAVETGFPKLANSEPSDDSKKKKKNKREDVPERLFLHK